MSSLKSGSQIAKAMLSSVRKPRSFLPNLHQRLFKVGRTYFPDSYISHTPDRYSDNIHLYRTRGGHFDPSMIGRFVSGNAANNSGDLSRYFFLTLASDLIINEGLSGDVAELGVYKGNTAFILATLAEKLGAKAYLFDTFEGFPAEDLKGIDQDKRPEFSDTSLSAVKTLVDSPAAVYVKGYFPDSLAGSVPDTTRFCLAHIDCDLHAPFEKALQYFYPRLVPGGFLIMHDYMSMHWNGVERAVDEFFADKPEALVPIPDKSGTVVIRRQRIQK